MNPARIDLYNGFGRPLKSGDADANRLFTFSNIEKQLAELDDLAGRVAMATGQFWLRTDKVTRKTTVDQQLLSDLAVLEQDLVADDLERATAQGLIGRIILRSTL